MSETTLPDGVGRVLTSQEEMEPFLRDFTGRFVGAARHVVMPTETAEVSRLLRWCSAQGIPIVTQGGNTGLAGGATPDASGDAILLSLIKMNRLRTLDLTGNTITVESGMVLQTLQDTATASNRFFPLALGAQGSCTVGGNLSTNAGGTGVLRYGSMRDLCLGLEVVTPSGDVMGGLRGLRKDNTGYDLRDLYIGAEGTLGVITAATLKLYPTPQARVTAWAGVASVDRAIELLLLAQQALSADLTAFELMSSYCVELVERKFADSPRVLARPQPWYVLLESSDQESASHAVARFETMMADACDRGVIVDAAVAQSERQSQQFWKIRERIGLSQPRNIKHDISLPTGRIAEFIARMEDLVRSAYPECRSVVVGHLGDGNIHYNVEPPTGLDETSFSALEKAVHRTVYDEVDRLRGSMSAEHGIGASKVEDLRRYKSDVELALMHAIKQALDPLGIMNPGKLIADPRITPPGDRHRLSDGGLT